MGNQYPTSFLQSPPFILCLSFISSFFLSYTLSPIIFFYFSFLIDFSVFSWSTILPCHREELAEMCCNNAGFDDNEPFPKITVRKSRNLKRPTEGKKKQKNFDFSNILSSSPLSSSPDFVIFLIIFVALYILCAAMLVSPLPLFLLFASEMATEAISRVCLRRVRSCHRSPRRNRPDQRQQKPHNLLFGEHSSARGRGTGRPLTVGDSSTRAGHRF